MDMLTDTDCVSQPQATTLTLHSAVTCSELDFGNADHKRIADSLCEFDCGVGEFGPQCKTCSAYKQSIGETAPPEYEWDDASTHTCDTKRIDGRDKCEEHHTRVPCMLSGDCDYVDDVCVYADVWTE